MSNNPLYNTPHRFRESSFRRYEPHIALIVDRFPDTVTITPGGDLPQSIETVAARLRDAMTAWKDKQWYTNKVDRDKFFSIHENIKCAIRETGLICGSADGIKLYDQLMAQDKDVAKPQDTLTLKVREPLKIDLSSSSTEAHLQLRPILEIAASNGLSRPILFLEIPEGVELFDDFDVTFIPQPDGSVLLLP